MEGGLAVKRVHEVLADRLIIISGRSHAPPRTDGCLRFAIPSAVRWCGRDGAALYGVDRLGDPYFRSASAAIVMVQAGRTRAAALDLGGNWCGGCRGRDLSPAAADSLRRHLEDRLERLHGRL